MNTEEDDDLWYFGNCQHCGAKAHKTRFTTARWNYERNEWDENIPTQWHTVRVEVTPSWVVPTGLKTYDYYVFCSLECNYRELEDMHYP